MTTQNDHIWKLLKKIYNPIVHSRVWWLISAYCCTQSRSKWPKSPSVLHANQIRIIIIMMLLTVTTFSPQYLNVKSNKQTNKWYLRNYIILVCIGGLMTHSAYCCTQSQSKWPKSPSVGTQQTTLSAWTLEQTNKQSNKQIMFKKLFQNIVHSRVWWLISTDYCTKR